LTAVPAPPGISVLCGLPYRRLLLTGPPDLPDVSAGPADHSTEEACRRLAGLSASDPYAQSLFAAAAGGGEEVRISTLDGAAGVRITTDRGECRVEDVGQGRILFLDRSGDNVLETFVNQVRAARALGCNRIMTISSDPSRENVGFAADSDGPGFCHFDLSSGSESMKNLESLLSRMGHVTFAAFSKPDPSKWYMDKYRSGPREGQPCWRSTTNKKQTKDVTDQPATSPEEEGQQLSIQRYAQRRGNSGFYFGLKVGNKRVGHVGGFEKMEHQRNAQGQLVFVHYFDVANVSLDESYRGKGLFQPALQKIADAFPNGLRSAKIQTSKAFEKAMQKMPTYRDDEKSHIILPQSAVVTKQSEKATPSPESPPEPQAGEMPTHTAMLQHLLATALDPRKFSRNAVNTAVSATADAKDHAEDHLRVIASRFKQAGAVDRLRTHLETVHQRPVPYHEAFKARFLDMLSFADPTKGMQHPRPAEERKVEQPVQSATDDIAVRTQSLNRLHALVREGLAAAGLDDPTFQKYRATTSAVFDRMSDGALRLAAGSVQGVRFFRTTAEINEAATRDFTEMVHAEDGVVLRNVADVNIQRHRENGDTFLASEIERTMGTPQGRRYLAGKAVESIRKNVVRESAGCYIKESGYVYIDGDDESIPGADRNVVRAHIYSHELFHGVDGLKKSLSDHPDWVAAWSKEIGKKGDPVRLGDYAQESASEGFAEFGAAVTLYAGPNGSLAGRFPLCAKFFKDHGLWSETIHGQVHA
jgi:hypothetical protein